MDNDFCPKCNALTNLVSSTTERNEKNDEGGITKIITISYHCNNCHTFVRSEDKIVSPGIQ